MGVDVAAEAGLRAVNVACHTVLCHLQLKFADIFFLPPNWRDLLHFHIMSRVMLVQRDFIFLFWVGRVLMAWYRIAAVQQTVSVLQQFVAGFVIMMRKMCISQLT